MGERRHGGGPQGRDPQRSSGGGAGSQTVGWCRRRDGLAPPCVGIHATQSSPPGIRGAVLYNLARIWARLGKMGQRLSTCGVADSSKQGSRSPVDDSRRPRLLLPPPRPTTACFTVDYRSLSELGCRVLLLLRHVAV